MTSKQFSASEWLAHVKAFQQSGLSRKRYCQQHGLTYHQFQYYYRHHYLKRPHTKRVKKAKSNKPPHVFAPIKLGLPSQSIDILELKFPTGISCSVPLSIEPSRLQLLIEVLSV